MEKLDFSPRNLYIIKKTLDSFGKVQLPTNLDVLQRCLNCILVDKLENKDAYEKVYEELAELYNFLLNIPIISKNQAIEKMKGLVNDYLKVRKNMYIYALDKKQKSSFDRREEIMDCFEAEDKFVEKLGKMFKIWTDNVFDHLKEEESIKFFSQQNKPKALNLLEGRKGLRRDFLNLSFNLIASQFINLLILPIH